MKRYLKPAASIALLVSAALGLWWRCFRLQKLVRASSSLIALKLSRKIFRGYMLAALATGIATLLQVADIYAGGMAGTGQSQI
jgi:hypothetical protein